MMQENQQQQVSLSVIVPCYNVEPYLDRSFRCLERQWNGRTDYEIILINDASTDGTICKINDFKQRFPNNVVVIDKKVNQGVAEARNSGLDVARGEWIVFFDPDDALVDNGYARLLDMVHDKGLDILSFEAEVVPDNEWNDSRTEAQPLKGVVWEGLAQDYMIDNHFGTCFRFLFKRDILEGRHFRSLKFLEDVVFVLPIFLSGAKLGKTDAKVYFYILRASSATNMIDPKRLNSGCDDILTAIQFMEQCKQGHSDAIQSRIGEAQAFYRDNLITRLILSDKGLKEIARHSNEINKLSIPQGQYAGVKERFYRFLFSHPALMVIFRPVYRSIRFVRSRFFH